MAAVRTMTDLQQLGSLALPQSRVTISTVGVVPRMRQLVRDLPGLSLALSLHAPTQVRRMVETLVGFSGFCRGFHGFSGLPTGEKVLETDGHGYIHA